MMSKTEYLAPGIHGPSLRWYRPLGFLALVLRTLIRFWITGKPIRGPGDNATFLHDATEDYRHRPVEKLTRARWRRLAWRWTTAGVPITLYATLSAWWAAGYLVLALGAGGTVAWRWWVVWWPRRDEVRDLILPTWHVICRVTGEKYQRRHALRSVELAWGEEDKFSARIHLPAIPLEDGIKKRIVASAAERLGVKDAASAWTIRGRVAYVDITQKVHPPTTLMFSQCRQHWLNTPVSRPFLGMAAGMVPVYGDMENDGPHFGLSGGTGTGKSTLLRVMLSKQVAAGHKLVVCDYKVTSHPWAKQLADLGDPRVLYLMDEAEIHEGIVNGVFAEFLRRREALKVDTSGETLAGFQTIHLLVEEVNSLALMLAKWWRLERKRLVQEAKDMDMSPVEDTPTVCPSIDAMAGLVQMGRELKIHVHFAAQRLDANALSPRNGGAIRESISNRLLAKYTKKAWDMLCGGVPYQAFPGGPRGIWVAVIGEMVTFFRVPPMTNAEAVELCVSGGRGVTEATIADALDLLGAAGPSLDAARKAVQRAGLKPLGRRGNAAVYDQAELERVLAS